MVLQYSVSCHFSKCFQLALTVLTNIGYSKHPHIRTHFSGLRLIVFLFEGCLVRNHPESVLKMFLIKIDFRNTSNSILLEV